MNLKNKLTLNKKVIVFKSKKNYFYEKKKYFLNFCSLEIDFCLKWNKAISNAGKPSQGNKVKKAQKLSGKLHFRIGKSST